MTDTATYCKKTGLCLTYEPSPEFAIERIVGGMSGWQDLAILDVEDFRGDVLDLWDAVCKKFGEPPNETTVSDGVYHLLLDKWYRIMSVPAETTPRITRWTGLDRNLKIDGYYITCN